MSLRSICSIRLLRFLVRLARGLPTIVERHAGECFGPLLEEALVCFVALLKDRKDPAHKLLVGARLTPHALRNGLRDLLWPLCGAVRASETSENPPSLLLGGWVNKGKGEISR